MTTVLVVADSGKVIQSFFHVNWKLLWHFQFKWKGASDPVPTITAIAARADVGPVNAGAPTQPPDLVALLQKPAPPFFNETGNAAKVNTAISGPPLREDLDTQLPGVPNDFFT